MVRAKGQAAQVSKGGLSRRLVAVGMAAAAWLAAGAAVADQAGEDVLAKVDSAINRYKTLQLRYDMLNQEPGKEQNKLEILARVKAGGKQLTELLGPADVKGTKVLILSASQMYVYLPAFGKVRRVASHVKDQGFLGTTFSQSDMALMRYGEVYGADLTSDDASTWTITLTPKADASPPYAKIVMVVDKAKGLPLKYDYFNAGGTHTKTETRSDYKCEGDICTPGEQKMVDHTKGDHWSKLVLKSYKINPSLPDDLFSKRTLQE
ncbi:MAG: outer membrane lipoprotein-sorting protein [Myxococcales bacterium]|nr:outer membrane lipoprotein-sorting protein [Myxococcales bacterium]